ncbi:MAG: hypothetical protein MRZ79_26445 [Bacteroidia bacterium]|nr:hypothetical protein [Bacteroidia bacterium]
MPLIWIPAIILMLGLSSCLTPKSQGSENQLKDIKNIVFVGDELMDPQSNQGVDEPIYALIQEKINQAEYPFHIINAYSDKGNSYSTIRELKPFLQSPVEILVVFCCQSDFDGSIPLDSSQQNVQSIIDLTLSKYPMSSVLMVNTMQPFQKPEEVRKWETMVHEMAINNQTAYLDLWKEERELRNTIGESYFQETISGSSKKIQSKLWQKLEPLL